MMIHIKKRQYNHLFTLLHFCYKPFDKTETQRGPISGRDSVGKWRNAVLDAKQHVCARKDQPNLESRFINVIKGYGVFASMPIEEGSFIVEYRGVLRDARECTPDAYSYYFIYNNTCYCIDASVDDGSLGRLVNDDSNPNAKVKVISINRIPHLCLFALRDIQPGEEITYDYGGYDLPWRRGTWLCTGKPQFDNKEEQVCEEPPPEADTTERTEGQQEQEACTKESASQTANENECEEEVAGRADKATQTTEENSSVEISWKYIPYQCLTSEHQRIFQNQLLQIQLTPEDKRISEDPDTSRQLPCDHEEKNQLLCSEDGPAVNEQHVNDVEPTSSNEEASESQLTNQKTDEVREMECNEEAEKQILEQQQTPMDGEPCVKEQSCPVSDAQHVTDVEPTSSHEEASESQLTNQMTDDEMTDAVKEMECNDGAEQQILEQQQTCLDVEPCVKESCPTSTAQTLEQQQTSTEQIEQCEEQSGPVAAAHSTCEEERFTCQDEPCQMQTQQQCNNDSSQTPNATQLCCGMGYKKKDTSFTKKSSEADQDSDLSNEESNDETVSSDEEFIPDSDTESDDDSDMAKPKKKAKTPVASKKVKEQEKPSTQNHLVTQATKLNFCFVCGKACTKISRHLKVHRKDNIEIATAFKLRKNSKERSHILEVLRNRGNYQHNNLVLINGSGLIKARRKPKSDIDTHKFEYCMYCKGLYARKVLWKHVRRCTSNPEKEAQKTSRSVLGLAALSQCSHLQHISEDVKKMLCDMHQDEVAQLVRNDEYVLKLAQDFYDKKGNSKEKHAFIRQTIRCLGKFLLLLQNKFAIRYLAEAIKPSSFPMIIEAVKEIAEYNEVTKCYAIPSLARRIGLALRKYCILTAQKAFAVGDRILIQATSTFTDLFNNAQSDFALGEIICLGRSFLLPFVNDVRKCHCYLEKAAHCATRELRETPSAQRYADLCKVTLAQILLFNRRHGEVSQMTIKNFQERDQAQPPEISQGLSALEKVFCEDYCKILVRQKVGALVPIILTPDMIDALMLLTETREQCSVLKSNIFVFGQPKSNKCYRGENALRICASECGAMNTDNLTSIKFSRHISTLTQFLTLKNHELKKLAKFIGHDISLQKEYYRQSEAGPRLAKICKLLLAIEKGKASDMLGHSLDDIELPEDINESDSEDEYFMEDNAFHEDPMIRHKLSLNMLYKSKTSKTNYSVSAPKRKKVDNESTSKEQEKESTSKEQENKSTSKEQDTQSTTKNPKAENLSQEQISQKLGITTKKMWTKEEKNAIMKHFKRHIHYGRLATVIESRRCQMLEQPVLNGRTIQKIRDFVRNAGVSFKKKMPAKNSLKNKFTLPPQPAKPNSTRVQSPQSTSSEPSSQTTNPNSSSVISPPSTDLIKPIILFHQNANSTTTTTLPLQVTLSTAPNAAHPQAKLVYIKVQANHSANQTNASLPLTSQAANPSIVPAGVMLPLMANPSISSANVLQIPQVANTSILIPQVPNHTGSSKPLLKPASLICGGVLVPQALNQTTRNILTLPAAKPQSFTMVPPRSSRQLVTSKSSPP